VRAAAETSREYVVAICWRSLALREFAIPQARSLELAPDVRDKCGRSEYSSMRTPFEDPGDELCDARNTQT